MTRPGRLAGRFAGTYPLAATYHSAALASEMERITLEVSLLVPEATGLSLPGEPATRVIDRAEWVERNLAVFTAMIEPAREHLARRLEEAGRGRGPSGLAQSLIEAETAAVLGVLSRRVLGQYELVLPTGGDGDLVVFVGANLLQMERTHQFRPSEFRFWVALHEMTHRAQFQGVPWLRRHFAALVAELVETAASEPRRLGRVVEELMARRERGEALLDERGLLGLLAGPGQIEVIDRVQALMTLLEGHGHVVMDRLGSRHLRSHERMSRVLKGRRMDRRTAAFLRVTGLEMKMSQYRKGERFVTEVERLAGWDAVGLAFADPRNLPTLGEIEHPGRWLQRVA